MYTFADIKQSLRRQDFDELTAVVPEFVSEESGSYKQVLQQMFYLAAHEQPGEQPPLGVVYLDAVRDLRTLYEEPATGPWPLFRVALRYFCTLRLREFDKEVTTMQPEDMGQIVMVDDFVESLRTGDTDTAVHEVVKLTWMMDNIFYLGEILTELAASAEEQSGFSLVLAVAVLKSIDFVESAQLNPLLFLLTEYLSRLKIGDPANKDATDLPVIQFERYFEEVFNAGQNDGMATVYLSYARQIWEAVRMKEDSIRRGIYDYLMSRYTFDENVTSATEYSTKQGTIQDIIAALTDGDMYGHLSLADSGLYPGRHRTGHSLPASHRYFPGAYHSRASHGSHSDQQLQNGGSVPESARTVSGHVESGRFGAGSDGTVNCCNPPKK